MVFESVVTDVLNKVLGDYVVNLDKKQLKIGIWGGDVVLKNLKLRENALDDIDLPIHLVHGYLGKLVLKIPWKNLYSQPVVAQIEDFFVLVTPKVSMKYDHEKEEKLDLLTKHTVLDALEAAHKKELGHDTPKHDATFTEKLTAQILNNLQVKISQVHVRYEDSVISGKPFSFGATLHDLELYTTDKNWKKCYLTEQVSRVFKITNLDSLSIYMNCTGKLFIDQLDENITNLFEANIATKDNVPEDYNYLFGPISSHAKLKINLNPEFNDPPFVEPKIDLSLEMEKLKIGLTSTQFQDIIKIGEGLNRIKIGERYRKYRPFNTPIKDNARLWWEFAINSVLEEDIRKRNRWWTWDYIKEHRSLCKTYAENLKERELNKKPPANLIEACTLLEQKLDLFNLILIQKQVQIEVDKIRKDEESKQKSGGGWFRGWFGGGRRREADEHEENIASKLEAAMTNDEKEKLYKAIGYEENAVPLDLPEEFEAVIMHFKLITLEIGLYDDQHTCEKAMNETMLMLNFDMTTCTVKQRPAASAISLTANMKKITLTGMERQTDIPPVLIESKISDENNLLDVFYESNPLDKTCAHRIKLHARPLQIVYHADTILQLAKAFKPPPVVNISELESAASEKMADLKERSATGMQYLIDTRPELDIDIDFMPNIFIIPHMGHYQPGKNSLIVITMGRLFIWSKPRQRDSFGLTEMHKQGHVRSHILHSIMENAYDHVEVTVEDMQVMIVKPRELWENVLMSAIKSEMHVLRPTTIKVNIDLCIVDDDPRLSQTKVNIEIPAISLNITEDRIFEALNVVTSLPLPENDEEPPPAPLTKANESTSSRLSLKGVFQERRSRKSTSPIESPTSAEIVQYTFVEMSFTLKELDATLYKKCGPYETCSPDSEAFGTPVETMEETVETAIVHFVDDEPKASGGTKKILAFKVLQVEANFYQRTYETVAVAKLGAIQLLQYDSCDTVDERLSIIDTPRFSEELESLFTVSYTMAKKISPEFGTKYKLTEQLVKIHFSTLQITLHQECLLRLLQIADSLQRQLEMVKKPPSPREGRSSGVDNIITKLAAIVEEEENETEMEGTETITSPKQSESRKSTSHTTVVDSIKLRIVADLEQVAVLFTCRQRPLASVKVEHFDANVVLKSSYTEIDLRLKDIIVTDLNPKTIHTNILSIVGKNALSCQVVLYNVDETANYNLDDMKIEVEIGCMKIVFLNWFVTSMLGFLNNFQAAQAALASASAAAADAAKQNAIDAYEKATRIKLNIKIKAPIIVVPLDSQSSEAMVLDLGMILLHNTTSEIRVPESDQNRAVLDEIKLELKKLKLFKVTMMRDTTKIVSNESVSTSDSLTGSVDAVDLAFEHKAKTNILDPISCTLTVKRNLSSAWYKGLPELDISGRLKSIELNVFMEDYALIMSILSRNLTEGAKELRSPPRKLRRIGSHTSLHRSTSDVFKRSTTSLATMTTPRKKEVKKEATPTKNYEQMKFDFQFDGVMANLMISNDAGLARFGIYFLSVKGKQLVDGTFSASVVLCNIQIEDTRESNKSQIKKYLCKKDWKYKDSDDPTNILDECKLENSYMVDVTAIMTKEDTFAKIRVCGFDLILCVDFLLHIANFFTLPEATKGSPKKTEMKQIPQLGSPRQGSPDKISLAGKSVASMQLAAEADKKMNVSIEIEEPDIILVESLEDINTNAIIFNAQANLNYRAVATKQIINGEINSLKMYMCSFVPERREATRHYIIHPCVISLHGSTPEEEGLHLSLSLSEIIINVSPATIELFNKALATISAGSADKIAAFQDDEDYSEIWNPQRFRERDHWFSRIEYGEDALLQGKTSFALLAQDGRSEQCVIEVPCITIVIETGVGYYTTPLISIDTRLNAIVNDWSKDMKMKGSLTLNMNYFNEALAIWEPIIEMNERVDKHGIQEFQPWELNFGLHMESKKSEIDEDTEEKTMKIQIHSEENLEITVSKTCLNVLGMLGEAFSQAIDDNGLVKPEVIAPYVVENNTGFEVTLSFEQGMFTLHECHMPKLSTTNALNRSVLFQNENNDVDLKPEEVKECKISPGGRAYLQTKDLSLIAIGEDEQDIYVQIGGIRKNLILPVSKSDRRFFPVYRCSSQEAWGVVSEVRSEYGTTKINLRGVLDVHNHFTTLVRIYRKNPVIPNENIFIGEVEPGAIFHIPLHAIYASIKDLYFAIDGYEVSVQGINWSESPTDLEYSRQLQCDPIDTFEPFYINVVRAKSEIFHEITDKYTLLSAIYTFHLRPPLYLCNALPISIKVSVAGCSVRNDEMPANRESYDSSDRVSVVKEDLLDYGEKEVDPGDILHLPTVKVMGRSKDSQSFLVVRILQYLEKDWSCTTEVTKDHTNLVTWKFSSYDSEAKMDMDLFVRFEDRYGSLLVTLFSPFWMINKTGLMLSYKTDAETVEVLYHPPEYNGPILFSFREKFFFDKKAATIRVDNGEWSNNIPLDVAGSIGEVTCKSNGMSYQIGVHNHLTNNSLTKQITFIPFYIANNKCKFTIYLQEVNRPADHWIKVLPGDCKAIWPKSDSDHMIVAKVDKHITVPFDYSEVQCTLLKLENSEYGGLNVDVQVTEGGVFINLLEYNPGDAPGLLINNTDIAISFHEKDTTMQGVIQPQRMLLYTWANPAGDKCIIFGNNKVESDLRRDDVGELILPDGSKAYWVSFLDGLQRVLLFTETESTVARSECSTVLQTITQSIELRIHGIGVSLVNNLTGVDILYIGIASSGVIWECKKADKERFKQMNIHETTEMEKLYQQFMLNKAVNTEKKYQLDKYEIDFGEMTMKKSQKVKDKEIRRTFYPGVWLTLNTSPFQTQLHAKINRIQIDNQLVDFIFPVVLAPIPPPKSVATSIVLKPFIECSVVQRVVPNSTVKQFKYAIVLIQEFHFKVDLLFLTAVAEIFSQQSSDKQAAKLFNDDVASIERPLSDLVETHSMLEQKNFYDNLHLGPLKIHVSFSMAGSDTTALPGILSTLVQGVGVTLTDVNDVVFRLAFFQREYMFFTQKQLTSEITTHYTGQALKQLYVLVLGLDVLGNPYGLVVGLKKGVEDLFYEPFHGAIQGPGEFAEGLALGVKSLFGHTVGGAAGAVSKITGAMGKGLAVLTFDDDYQKKRRQYMNKKPANFSEGIARSGKSLVMGFYDGVTGVVSKPVAGAKEDGIEGFFKGLGKGAIGFVAHPTSGVVDFASGSLDAVKRATEGHQDLLRLRPPRFLQQDNVLRPYCRAEAEGNKLLKEIDKGKFAATDIFVHCEEIVPKSEFLLITNQRVMYVTKSDLFGTFSVSWKYRWDKIDTVNRIDGGIEIKLKKETKKVMGLFSTSEVVRKTVLIADEIKRDRVVQHMESQYIIEDN